MSRVIVTKYTCDLCNADIPVHQVLSVDSSDKTIDLCISCQNIIVSTYCRQKHKRLVDVLSDADM